MASDSGLTRFAFDGNVAHRGGQQFVNGTGYGSDAFEEVHRPEPHGFASHPVKGGIGLVMQSRSNRDSAYAMGGENPALRPDIPQGAVALYDHLGNIIKLIGTGAVFDFKNKTATLTAGEWSIAAERGVSISAGAAGTAITGNLRLQGKFDLTGDLTVNGNIKLNGNMLATGSVVDGDGDGGA